MKINKTENIQLLAFGMSTSYMLICSAIALFNFNFAAALFVLGSLFISKIHPFQYWILVVALLIKSQNDITLSSSDLESYLYLYNSIEKGYNPFQYGFAYKGPEVLLPAFFWLLSIFAPTLTINQMSFIFILLFSILFYPIAKKFTNTPIIFISLVVLIDVILVVHLFRQCISSLILLFAIINFTKKDRRNKFKGLLLYLIAGFTHSTNFLFGIFGTSSTYTSVKYLKLFLVVSAIVGFYGIQYDLFAKISSFTYDETILRKANYGLSLVGIYGGQIRIIGLISAGLSLLVFNSHPLFRIYLFFAALGLFFYQVPILAPRIGLISSSILTGLPIGLFLNALKGLIVNKKLNYFYAKS